MPQETDIGERVVAVEVRIADLARQFQDHFAEANVRFLDAKRLTAESLAEANRRADAEAERNRLAHESMVAVMQRTESALIELRHSFAQSLAEANMAGKVLIKLGSFVAAIATFGWMLWKIAQDVLRSKGVGVAFFVAVAAAALSCQATAATYYVDPTGSNTAAGTISAPWASINYAATRVAPGDIVIAKGGTYRESVRTTISGTAGAPIVYRADNPGQAKLAPPANNGAIDAWEQSGSYVTIAGFDVDGSAHLSGTRWARGITVTGQHSTVTMTTVHDIGRAATCADAGYGIGAAGGAYLTLHANTVRDIGPAGGC